MPQLLPTIEEFIATDIKRQGYWMVFNSNYNEFCLDVSDTILELDQRYTDEEARSEFLTYMHANFPDVRLVEVYDFVSSGHISWPYLGSIAIDMQPGDAVYAALSERYGDTEQDPKFNNAVLWTMMLEDAIAAHEARCQMMEDF